VSLSARRSHRVIADSASTRDDLVRLLGVPAAKIDVAPLGVSPPATEPLPERELRSRYGLGERRLLLTLSAKRRHKNLDRLLAALSLIEPERRPLLVLPGYQTGYEQELRRQADALGLGGDTLFVGWIPAAELEALYRAADAFVFPSLYEGFGLPVLEAMARGVPVACSDRGSLREVAGAAAKLFDPESPPAIATAVEELLADPAEAERLRAAGREQASRFSWRATARATLASYARALSPPE
jgi:glycosyltransferase involved in cell wall biosynthesis